MLQFVNVSELMICGVNIIELKSFKVIVSVRVNIYSWLYGRCGKLFASLSAQIFGCFVTLLLN